MSGDENPYRPPGQLPNDAPAPPSQDELVARGRLLYLGIVLFFLSSNALGGIKVQVARRDAERALEVMADAKARGELATSADKTPDVPFEPIRFECEECGKPVAFPADRRGKVEVCPHCHEYLDVPE